MTPQGKKESVRAWAIVDRDGYIGKSHLTPDITAYQIFDTDCVSTPYMIYKMIPVEIRPIHRKKKLK